MFKVYIEAGSVPDMVKHLETWLEALNGGETAGLSAKEATRIAGASATVNTPKPTTKPKPEPEPELEPEDDKGDVLGDEAEKPTLDDVRNILVEARAAAGDKGPAIVVSILEKFGAKSLPTLDAAHFADAIAEGKKILAKHKKK